MKSKKLKSAVLVAITMLGTAAAPAQMAIPTLQTAIVASAETYDEDMYTVHDDKTLGVTGYTGDIFVR